MRPGIASCGHTSPTRLWATGSSSSTSSERIEAAFQRSSLVNFTWICIKFRKLGEVTRSPGWLYFRLHGLHPLPGVNVVSTGALYLLNRASHSSLVFSFPAESR